MTPPAERLRRLAAQATVRFPSPEDEPMASERYLIAREIEDAHYRLVALAPELALLAADALEALAWADENFDDCGDETCQDCAPYRRDHALLARAAALVATEEQA